MYSWVKVLCPRMYATHSPRQPNEFTKPAAPRPPGPAPRPHLVLHAPFDQGDKRAESPRPVHKLHGTTARQDCQVEVRSALVAWLQGFERVVEMINGAPASPCVMPMQQLPTADRRTSLTWCIRKVSAASRSCQVRE